MEGAEAAVTSVGSRLAATSGTQQVIKWEDKLSDQIPTTSTRDPNGNVDFRQSEVMRLTEPDALEYFSGGVPSGEYFRLTLEDLKSISDSDDNDQRGVNRLQELCFIGLISYFEAFCKDHFAALVNIEP